MDNLKYSVKTQQFGKKRYQIFPKQGQKQSMSLQVHDPKHGVSHLVEMTKSEDHSAFFQLNKQNEQVKPEQNQQQQVKTVKFNRGTYRKQNQQQCKNKNSNHSISNTAKIAVPYEHNNINLRDDGNLIKMGVITDLQALKCILINNEERLSHLVDSINTLYRNTIELYNNHERKLKELVNYRCYDIAKLFRAAIFQLKQKDDDLRQVDNRANLLLNTLKDTKETLRIVKIKQQCIQALQKEHSIYKKQPLKFNSILIKKQQDQNPQLENRTIVKKPTNDSQNSKKRQKSQIGNQEIFKKLPTFSDSCIGVHSDQSPLNESIVVNQEQQIVSATSFVIFSSKNTQTKEQYKKSPFQANQLLLISNTMPASVAKPIKQQFKQTQYSFRRKVDNNQNWQVSHNSVPMKISKPQLPINLNVKQTQNSQNYERIKLNLQKILKTILNKQVWQDNLNCLRRPNGTYIFDQEGNVIICSQQEYAKLLKQQILMRPQKLK